MSEQIKAGDLAIVLRHHCNPESRQIGRVFTVSSVGANADISCERCKEKFPLCTVVWTGQHSPSGSPYGFPIGYVKRIPPLSELDDVKQDEEIEA